MKYTLINSMCAALLLSACASTGLKEPFAPTDPDAIVLGGSKYSNWILERVDMDAKTATGEYANIAGPSWVDTPRLKGEQSELVFGIKKVKSGLYALESGSTSGWNGVGTVSSTYCFDDAAPIYKIEAGKINILPMYPVERGSQSPGQLREVEKILQDHPDITATAIVPKIVATVDYGRRTRKERCKYDEAEKPLEILKTDEMGSSIGE